MNTDLFGNQSSPPQPEKRKLNQSAANAYWKLIQLYGKKDGEKCKNCAHLGYTGNSSRYYKCTKFSTSNSASSDWRVNWDACGLFEKEEE